MKRKMLILLVSCLILTFLPTAMVGTIAAEPDQDFACAYSMQSTTGE